ncbi:MAG TPA: hypothetical protein VG672_20890 [Bryobacteraceae bacterium]|nr:hypothetical protein [Bryobacteraceae bacterium]
MPGKQFSASMALAGDEQLAHAVLPRPRKQANKATKKYPAGRFLLEPPTATFFIGLIASDFLLGGY